MSGEVGSEQRGEGELAVRSGNRVKRTNRSVQDDSVGLKLPS